MTPDFPCTGQLLRPSGSPSAPPTLRYLCRRVWGLRRETFLVGHDSELSLFSDDLPSLEHTTRDYVGDRSSRTVCHPHVISIQPTDSLEVGVPRASDTPVLCPVLLSHSCRTSLLLGRRRKCGHYCPQSGEGAVVTCTFRKNRRSRSRTTRTWVLKIIARVL